MPDYCMCTGLDCPLKTKCCRYLAEPNPYRQSYFSEPPFQNGQCKYFWDKNAGSPFKLRQANEVVGDYKFPMGTKARAFLEKFPKEVNE